MASPTRWASVLVSLGFGDRQGSLACCVHGVTKSQTRLSDQTELTELSLIGSPQKTLVAASKTSLILESSLREVILDIKEFNLLIPLHPGNLIDGLQVFQKILQSADVTKLLMQQILPQQTSNAEGYLGAGKQGAAAVFTFQLHFRSWDFWRITANWIFKLSLAKTKQSLTQAN